MKNESSKSVLVRFRVTDGDTAAIDDASVVGWHIARSLEANLKREGLAAAERCQAQGRRADDP